MTYLGDFKEDGDLYFKFTTRAFATGIPTQLAGVPVLSCWIDEADGTEKTSAEAYFDLDVDFDTITGLNNVRIDLSGDAFFATAADYAVAITTGTVGGVSVVGETLFTFSIENRFNEVTVTALAADVITPASVIDNADFIIQALSITNVLDAGSVLVDGTTTLTGNVSMGGTFDVVDALTAGSVSIDAGFDVVGALSANSFLVDTTTTLTGAVELSSTLGIVGVTTFTGAVILNSTLATGAVTLDALTVSNLTTLTGNVSLGGTLGITGTTSYTGNVSYADGITVAAPSTLNRGGIDVTGNGTGSGLGVAGGATGHGISAVSGGVGDGIYAHSATTGHGLHCVGGGVAGDGIHADGDTNGDGITAVGVGAGQYDINADIHGTIDTVTTNTDLVTAAAIRTAMEADGGDLSSLMEALVNKLLITELNGNAQIFNDAGVAQGIVLAAFTSVANVTQRKRMVI